jgi:hypothetical protein
MTATNGIATTTVEGLVEATNANGIKVRGDWLNRSAFGTTLELPTKGAYVRAQVDGRGYIKSLETISAPAAGARTERDETISRLAVLKAAANFLGQLSQTREDVRSEHVIVLADRWLDWVAKAD